MKKTFDRGMNIDNGQGQPVHSGGEHNGLSSIGKPFKFPCAFRHLPCSHSVGIDGQGVGKSGGVSRRFSAHACHKKISLQIEKSQQLLHGLAVALADGRQLIVINRVIRNQ